MANSVRLRRIFPFGFVFIGNSLFRNLAVFPDSLKNRSPMSTWNLIQRRTSFMGEEKNTEEGSGLILKTKSREVNDVDTDLLCTNYLMPVKCKNQ
ncbi:hypothetical protein GOBAR_DD32457 [Gossypium barbadense]|nr:hypothetical protein GOBAR_DD32457 [Gossypium barbadense]